MLGYFAGGAGDEVTLRDNVAAWERWQLRPRMLAGNPSLERPAELLGGELSMPILVAPVAFQRMVDPEGEVAMARAAAAAGTAMCLSTLATSLPAEIAAAAPGGRQLVPALLLQRRRGDQGADGRGGRVRASRRSWSPSTPLAPATASATGAPASCCPRASASPASRRRSAPSGR